MKKIREFVLQKIKRIVNNLFQKNQPIQLLDQETIDHYFLDSDATKYRIKCALSLRRFKKEIPKTLPSKPNVFIAVKNVNWEKAGLVDSWKNLVRVIHYDWGDEFDQHAKNWNKNGKLEFNKKLFEKVSASHSKQKIDIFFSYLSGKWVYKETIEKIRDLGIITINIDFDDTLKFWDMKEDNRFTGSAEIASYFDICLSCQSINNIGKYVATGANPYFIPPGGNNLIFSKYEPAVEKKREISFIGQKYGQREGFIQKLSKNGIKVDTYGLGWEKGSVSQEEMLKIYTNSLLTLGFGYISDTNKVGLKGRDFEVPMTGCAYITTYNKELALFFEEDKEIIFYRNKIELVDKIRFYINNPQEAIKIGFAGRKRALHEHKWEDRWMKVLDLCI